MSLFMKISTVSARRVLVRLAVVACAGAFLLACPARAALAAGGGVDLVVPPRETAGNAGKAEKAHEATARDETFERRSYRDQLGGQPGRRSWSDDSASVMPYQPYTDWSWPGQGYTSTSQTLTIEHADPGSHYFWAYDFAVGGDGVGYTGLQIGAYPAINKIALFAIWGADGAQGANCGSFGNEGLGWGCRIDPFDWTAGRPYALRVAVDGGDTRGTWYKATILDLVSGQLWTIGRIHQPFAGGRLIGRGSWTEWFGYPAESCQALKRSRVRWELPRAQGGTVGTTSHFNHAQPKDGSTACAGSATLVDEQGSVSQRVAPK